jgi:Domain of unknown function (DUF397)
MDAIDLSAAVWKKSRRSNGQANCVEVARNLPGIVAVRDSKNPDGLVLAFTTGEWVAFTSGVRRGEFEL